MISMGPEGKRADSTQLGGFIGGVVFASFTSWETQDDLKLNEWDL